MPDDVPVSRRPTTWLVVAAIALVIAVVGLVVALIAPAPQQSADAAVDARPSPTAETAPTPVALPEPTPERDPRIPEDCAAIYTFDWADTFAPEYVLNPAWSTADGAPALWGTDDATALPILQETSQLTCGWLPPDTGDGRIGMVTDVAAVDEAQTSAVIAAFQAAGMDCYVELDGTRCVSEFGGVTGEAGESHYIRDGLWIATRWDGPAVSGYTLDIVAQLLG